MLFVEIARLLIAAAAEADVVCKQICRKLNASSDAAKLHEYRDPILTAYPLVPHFEVRTPSYGLQLQPWSNWNQVNGVPLWWTAYNKIKHHRDTEYHRANLKNVLDAVAGLFVVCVYLYKEKAELGEHVPSPAILRPSEERFGAAFSSPFLPALLLNFPVKQNAQQTPAWFANCFGHCDFFAYLSVVSYSTTLELLSRLRILRAKALREKR